VEIPRMTKEELKGKLNDPATVIIDVRRDQDESSLKIPGAIAHDPDKVEAWAKYYRKDQPLVLY